MLFRWLCHSEVATGYCAGNSCPLQLEMRVDKNVICLPYMQNNKEKGGYRKFESWMKIHLMLGGLNGNQMMSVCLDSIRSWQIHLFSVS